MYPFEIFILNITCSQTSFETMLKSFLKHRRSHIFLKKKSSHEQSKIKIFSSTSPIKSKKISKKSPIKNLLMKQLLFSIKNKLNLIKFKRSFEIIILSSSCLDILLNFFKLISIPMKKTKNLNR